MERSCSPPKSPAAADSGIVTGLPVPTGLNSQRGFGSSRRTSAKVEAAFRWISRFVAM